MKYHSYTKICPIHIQKLKQKQTRIKKKWYSDNYTLKNTCL